MIARCDNPKTERYERYGGRGITYCERWKLYEHFLEDMGEQPARHSIDRIDNDKDYCKENCRWATPKEQNLNRSTSVNYKGECAKDASIRLGATENLVQKRILRGWPIDKAFNTPPIETGLRMRVNQ